MATWSSCGVVKITISDSLAIFSKWSFSAGASLCYSWSEVGYRGDRKILGIGAHRGMHVEAGQLGVASVFLGSRKHTVWWLQPAVTDLPSGRLRTAIFGLPSWMMASTASAARWPLVLVFLSRPGVFTTDWRRLDAAATRSACQDSRFANGHMRTCPKEER